MLDKEKEHNSFPNLNKNRFLVRKLEMLHLSDYKSEYNVQRYTYVHAA